MAYLQSSKVVSLPIIESQPHTLGFFGLPNELLMQILCLFHTQDLLRLMNVCHHFRDLIIRIIQNRLILAESLEDRKLILECYHPSAQYAEPYLFCDYLGTLGLSDGTWGQRSLYDIGDADGCFDNLGGLYSRFKPTRIDKGADLSRRHRSDGFRKASDLANSDVGEDEIIRRKINMDPHELFSQLCISVGIVQVGPRRGVFLSCIDVLKKTTARVWRQWLAENSVNSRDPATCYEPERLIWADQSRHVGLRVRVKERKWKREILILQYKDEDHAVSYNLELEELLVRSTYLLVGVEQSLFRKNNSAGNAMIFGSFATSDTP